MLLSVWKKNLSPEQKKAYIVEKVNHFSNLFKFKIEIIKFISAKDVCEKELYIDLLRATTSTRENCMFHLYLQIDHFDDVENIEKCMPYCLSSEGIESYLGLQSGTIDKVAYLIKGN